MNDDQIYDFTERFEAQAVNHQMTLKNYKESLGLIGTDSLSFMADRMFAAMDLNHDGCVSLNPFLIVLNFNVCLFHLDYIRRVSLLHRYHALRLRGREAHSELCLARQAWRRQNYI